MRQAISVAHPLVIVLGALTFLTGCPNQNDIIACDSQGCISEKNFGNNIVASLKAKPGVVGYVVTVGAYPSNFGGNAVLPSTGMVPTDISNVASVSKMLTTFAVLKSLTNHNISLDSSIFPYLYTDWQSVAGSNIKKLTFRDLLTHRSGFPSNTASNGCNGNNTAYAILKSYMQANYAPLAAGALGVYSNCNFAIFRELLPQMEGDPGPNALPDNLPGAPGFNPRALTSAGFYIAYVNQNVLSPGGVYGTRNCTPTTNSAYQVLSYPPPPATTPNTNWGDWTLTCGGGGWNMSAGDLTFVFNALAGGSLLTSAQEKELYSGSGQYAGLGWDNTVGNCPGAYQNEQTYYWCKNGGLGGAPNAGIETFTGLFKCNKVPVVVLVNSAISQNITSVVTSAFSAPTTKTSGSPQACSG